MLRFVAHPPRPAAAGRVREVLALTLAALALLLAWQRTAARPVPEPVVLEVPVLRYAEAPATAAREAVIVTAYNSEPEQTDATPFITATGQRVRWGVAALSRDLLARYPYGTRLVVLYAGGRGCGALEHPQVFRTVFVVADTMHPRKRGQIDLWMPEREAALTWGRCNAQVLFLQ